jgi:hypothetical protein
MKLHGQPPCPDAQRDAKAPRLPAERIDNPQEKSMVRTLLDRHHVAQAAAEAPRGWVPSPSPLPQDGKGGTPQEGPTVEEIKQGKTVRGGETPPPESPEQESHSGFPTGNS